MLSKLHPEAPLTPRKSPKKSLAWCVAQILHFLAPRTFEHAVEPALDTQSDGAVRYVDIVQ